MRWINSVEPAQYIIYGFIKTAYLSMPSTWVINLLVLLEPSNTDREYQTFTINMRRFAEFRCIQNGFSSYHYIWKPLPLHYCFMDIGIFLFIYKSCHWSIYKLNIESITKDTYYEGYPNQITGSQFLNLVCLLIFTYDHSF